MSVPFTLSVVALAVVVLAILIELGRLRAARRRAARRKKPVQVTRYRLVDLEQKMAENVLRGPQAAYGDIFASYSIWRQAQTVQMDIVTKALLWNKLNDFTRCLVVRAMWVGLQAMTGGTVVVIVDRGTRNAITWTHLDTVKFDDHGVVEPWKGDPKKPVEASPLSGLDQDAFSPWRAKRAERDESARRTPGR